MNGKTRRRVICPECGAKMAFTAPADAALAITCPKCRRSLRLPPLQGGEAGSKPVARPAPAPVRSRRPMLLMGLAAAALALAVLAGGLWALDLLPGFGTEDPTDAVADAETTAVTSSNGNVPLGEQALAVLKKNCHECHGDGGSDEGGFNFVLNRATLVDAGYIVPGDAESSYLLERITEGEMPPEDARVRPSEQEAATLRRWIEAGAEDFAPPVARTFITGEAMFSAIRDDLRLETEERDREYVRYFTLTHLHNAGLSEDELQTYRLALSKLINSLSWEKELVIPRAIDEAGTVLRVDLRDLDWTEETWQAIIDADPYAIAHSTPAAQLCRDATGCTVPVVRGDWFVSAASSAPLYYKVLGVPETGPMAMLEERVGLDVERSIAEEKVRRAGFGKSDVSQNNRMIERHATDHGAMWISYDFAGNTGRQNLFLHPLGPGDAESNFRHDGGEIIFNLPNGLQGYMLVNANGLRVDKAPTAI
ncbi:MAG: c-type cytochrome domain-containing protein, partial [Planctomycetaceae bacterium]